MQRLYVKLINRRKYTMDTRLSHSYRKKDIYSLFLYKTSFIFYKQINHNDVKKRQHICYYYSSVLVTVKVLTDKQREKKKRKISKFP